MANVYATKTGNWSDVTVWNTGALPTAADDVRSNGFTVTINQDITVISINNTASTPAVAGGGFTVSTNNLTINANINYGGVAVLTASQSGTLTIVGNFSGTPTSGGVSGTNFTSTGTINITGNVTAISANTNISINNTGGGIINLTGNIIGGLSNGSIGINLTNASILNVTGNITGGSGIDSYGVQNANTSRISINGITTGGSGGFAINVNSLSSTALTLTGACIASNLSALANSSTGTVIINSSQTAAGVANIYLIRNLAAGVITINGDCFGALSATPSTAFILLNNSTGTININGSVTARSVSPSATIGIVNNASTGTINVSTNVTGGSVANTIGISNTTTGTINVTGNITGGSNATNTPAIYSITAGTIDVTGSCSADAYPALFSTSTTAVNRLRGNVLTKNGIIAAYVWKMNISPTAAQQFTFQDTANANRLIATSNISPGAPGIADVRFGTVYGSSSEYTGTLRVPNPNTVSLGVLTDNTTGTMIMTPADFWGVASSGLTTAGSIGERLKVASTVQSTGDQLASYIV